MNHPAPLLADTSLKLVLHGLWNGFKSIPVAVWNLFPNNVKTIYNLSFILGMLIFMVLFLMVFSRPRRVWTYRRRVRA